jgi:hypothetical protein
MKKRMEIAQAVVAILNTSHKDALRTAQHRTKLGARMRLSRLGVNTN